MTNENKETEPRMRKQSLGPFAKKIQAACPAIRQMKFKGTKGGTVRFEVLLKVTEDTLGLVRLEFYCYPDTPENRKLANDVDMVSPASAAVQLNTSDSNVTVKTLAKEIKHELEQAGFGHNAAFIVGEYETQVAIRFASAPVLWCTVIDSVQDAFGVAIPRNQLRPKT